MSDVKEGSAVKCAFCHKEVKVQHIVEHAGETAYSLSCFHRNTLCPTCDHMAKDVSETIKEVHRHCEFCDGPLDEDDDE
jgi:hypothetical protein